MGEVLEVAKVLVQPTMKLMDMVSSAIGTAYEPRHKRKMADATAYEINVIGDAMRNAADMPVLYNKDGVAINSEDFNRLMQRAGTRFVFQETVKQRNIENVLDYAYADLETCGNVVDEPIDDDWISSFFDFVANISNEQMHLLWGKILAGEVKSPGSFSIRTLDTVRKMSQKEAEAFEKIVPMVLICDGDKEQTYKDYFILNFDEYIDFSSIVLLQEAGLINSSNLISVDICIPEFDTGTVENLFGKIEIYNNQKQEVTITKSVNLLTEAGRDLYLIMKEKIYIEPEGYLKKCCEELLETEGIFNFLNEEEAKNLVPTVIYRSYDGDVL